MRRPHAALLLLLLLGLVAAGCGSGADDESDGDAHRPTADETALDGGDFTQPGLATGAPRSAFCDAITAADDAVTTARPGNDDDWLAVVAALDAIYDVGVPSDLPAPARDEIDLLDRLVRQSNSVSELRAARRREGASSPAIEAYVGAHCAD